MTNIGLLGANGRMGRAIIEAISQTENASLVAATVRGGSPLLGVDSGTMAGIDKNNILLDNQLDRSVNSVGVVIDFTLPSVLIENLDWCVKNNKPIVIGTTGLNKQQKAQLSEASKHIPIVFAANYSVGVNLLLNLVKQAARIMGQSADIEILEAHHRHKLDAPSGTAMALGEVIAEELDRPLEDHAVYGREGHTGERDPNTIGFATVRAGDIVGEHTVLFAELGERLELTHKATSRLTFAKGAVRAANWLSTKPAGLYDMRDVLGL
jgi:4-hydroxy-tetrahydrodipicolinate reductase